MKKHFLIQVLIIVISLASNSQEALKYQLPPDEIVKIVDAPVTPMVSVSPDKSAILIIDRAPIITISELSNEELRLAGLRIDPATSGPSRQSYNTGFKIMDINGTNVREITGLPGNPRFGFPSWTEDGKKFVFTNTTQNDVELWVCDVLKLTVSKIADNLNMVFGRSVSWLPDNKSLIYSVNIPDRGQRPERSPVPVGPVIQENLGKEGQAATYQDLLKDPVDEAIFEYFAMSQLMLWNGTGNEKLGRPAMIAAASPSPDGSYILLNILQRPFSYIVPYYRFPVVTIVWDIKGNPVKTLLEMPLVENEPRGYDKVLPGRRGFSWRSDRPSTITWAEALDEGDFTREMKYHDQIYYLNAPFSGDPVKLIAAELRYNWIIWGTENFALIQEGSDKTRMLVTSSFNPADPQPAKKKIQEFNSDDGYNNPGRFVTDLNNSGMRILLTGDKGKSLFLSGNGASPEGDRPFIDKYDITSGKTTRLWRSEAPSYETFSSFIDLSKGLILTSRQSVTD
ncbi:MAG: hypothetical protein WAL29_10745, partial [Bacteroidales bacterium]